MDEDTIANLLSSSMLSISNLSNSMAQANNSRARKILFNLPFAADLHDKIQRAMRDNTVRAYIKNLHTGGSFEWTPYTRIALASTRTEGGCYFQPGSTRMCPLSSRRSVTLYHWFGSG